MECTPLCQHCQFLFRYGQTPLRHALSPVTIITALEDRIRIGPDAGSDEVEDRRLTINELHERQQQSRPDHELLLLKVDVRRGLSSFQPERLHLHIEVLAA